MASNGKTTVSLGTFTFERSTKNTHVFLQPRPDGRDDAQYVPKAKFPEGSTPPAEIEVQIVF